MPVAGMLWFALTVPAVPALPNINTNNVVVIIDAPYNAVGDGVTTNTAGIQAAIHAAAAGGTTNGAAGGTVEIPPGVYLSGPLTMASSVNLQIDAGAILRMLPLGKYPGGTASGTTFISGSNLHDIEISGSGAIDGQGAAWWPYANVSGANRPRMISPSDCNRLLIQNVTLSNSPMFHIAISGTHAANSTVRGATIRAPSNSPNTDACDVSGTNILVENCNISVGDDDFTCGGGTHDVLVTNNTYGTGHGISIGSYTDKGGVSNVTVVNCTISGAVNGIRIKSDNDRGGLVQNISYSNIGMTNVNFPIIVYAYYHWFGTPSGISPAIAAGTNAAAVTSETPIYRNITFSNITATSVGNYPAAIIWARKEMAATNLVFNRVHVSASRPFEIYNARGVRLTDSRVSGNNTNLWLFNAQVIVSNSVPTNALFTLDGLTTNGYGNSFIIFNARASLQNTNCFDNGPLTLGAGTFIVSNNLTLFPYTVLNFTLGTNAATVSVISNLTLGGVINFTNGAGFANGTYTLLTCGKTLGGSLPALAGKPEGYNYLYSFDTNTPGQVRLLVQSPPSPVFAAAGLSASGRFNFEATNGLPGDSVYVLTATNVALPLEKWTPVATNQFDGNGQLQFTNAAGPAAPQAFYRLKLP
jgi:polygalacturonase